MTCAVETKEIYHWKCDICGKEELTENGIRLGYRNNLPEKWSLIDNSDDYSFLSEEKHYCESCLAIKDIIE